MKELVKTKTFWSGIAAIGLGVTQCVMGNTQDGIQSIIAGFSIIFIRSAIQGDKNTIAKTEDIEKIREKLI